MTEELFPSPNGKKSLGNITREKIAKTLRTSHNLVSDTAQNVSEILTETLRASKNRERESEYVIPLVVEYVLYGADDVGRDLGEVARGILEGVAKTAGSLNINTSDAVEKTARALLLESDWRDIDLRIVIESFVRKSIPEGKDLLKKIFEAEKKPEELRKAA